MKLKCSTFQVNLFFTKEVGIGAENKSVKLAFNGEKERWDKD